MQVFFKFVNFKQTQLINLYDSEQRSMHWFPDYLFGRLHHQSIFGDYSADAAVSETLGDGFEGVAG